MANLNLYFESSHLADVIQCVSYNVYHLGSHHM